MASDNTPESAAAAGADARSDADALLEVIRNAPGRIVAVVGARSSGKSKFIREQIMPALQDAGPAILADCASGLTEDAIRELGRPGTVVLDSFERFLKSPEPRRKAGLEAILDPARKASLVLVTDGTCVGDLFELRRMDPSILDHLFELSELCLSTELPRYGPPARPAVPYEPAQLDALENDLASLDEPVVTWLLIRIIDEAFRTGAYDKEKGLLGLIQDHANKALSALDHMPEFGEGAKDIARELLKDIARLPEPKGDATQSAVALRLDVEQETVAQILNWLTHQSELVRYNEYDGWRFRAAPVARGTGGIAAARPRHVRSIGTVSGRWTRRPSQGGNTSSARPF